MKSIIEVAKFEPEPTLENTINKIKSNHLKSITSLDMNISDITLNKPYFPSEHISCHEYSENHRENRHNSINNCLQRTRKETLNHRFEYGELLLNQNYIYHIFGQTSVSTFQYSAPGSQQRKHSNRRFTSSKQQLFIHKQYQ